MNIAPLPTAAAYPTQEPPRTAQQQPQETSRPVLAPTRSEAMAQEVREGDKRDSGREARAESAADSHGQPADAPRGNSAHDPLVGAILDVFV